MSSDDADVCEYVTARLDQLRRTAYLLCGDWHAADDVMSTAVMKLMRHWRRIREMDNIDSYARPSVQATLTECCADTRRRYLGEGAIWPGPRAQSLTEQTSLCGGR